MEGVLRKAYLLRTHPILGRCELAQGFTVCEKDCFAQQAEYC
jgi:hypothetical protein